MKYIMLEATIIRQNVITRQSISSFFFVAKTREMIFVEFKYLPNLKNLKKRKSRKTRTERKSNAPGK
jgi:hypothetical protein